jgi:glyoxylase-like metal-dependent hydrolase (beta-lactamase superfamily II)
MPLPPDLHVLERGWLSSNNVLLRDADGVDLVDTGYSSHIPQTLALLDHALRGAPLRQVVNTHCHSDHMGGNAAIQHRYACPVAVPIGEAPMIAAWDDEALLLTYADQRAERFAHDATFAPGDTLRLGGSDWHVIAAPGHDTHATMLYSPEARVLISGDALWENGFGVLFPQMFGRASCFAETRATLDAIAALDVDTVIPGHGAPFTAVDAALDRAYSRLHAFEEDPARVGRHAAKVMITFSLLEHRRMGLAELPAYVERVGILRDLNRRYFAMTPERYAAWLVHELERTRAIRRADGAIEPLVAA